MIGYACLPKGYRDYKFKKIFKKDLNYENYKSVISYNLDSLERIIDYNIERKIGLFRISSDVIPFGDRAEEYINWEEEFLLKFKKIGEKIKTNNIRVSMHPGQYTLINSREDKVVENSKKDLLYHAKFLDALGLDGKSKLILHIGGVYGDKDLAIERFIENYKGLDQRIKDRLVIENDHRSYNVDDLLRINKVIDIPLVFDNLHNEILAGEKGLSEIEIIDIFSKTWKEKDGRQKIHYSQQAKEKRIGSHSSTIELGKFKEFYNKLKLDVDIMLEVKDKDLSTIKCNNAIFIKDIKYLELEWSRYKYNILEHSPSHYEKIRQVLKDKDSYPVDEFYSLIDEALEKDIEKGNFINAFEHVWGYFKRDASQAEIDKKESYIKRYKKSSIREKGMKSFLEKLAYKYKKDYLIQSYYFNF